MAPEHRFPTQLDEFSAVVDWVQTIEGAKREIVPDLVFGDGDSTGGNTTEALALRRRDEEKKNFAGQLLRYPESRVPFDTPAATENNSGYYLECNDIFSFADHYLPKALGKNYAPSFKYVSRGMLDLDSLKNQPSVALFTSGFDSPRDVGVEYGSKLQEAGVDVQWHHYPNLTHRFLQIAPWSEARCCSSSEASSL